MSFNVTLNFSLLVYFDVDRHAGLLNFKKGYPGLLFWHSINPRRQAGLSEWGSGLIYEVVHNDRASCSLGLLIYERGGWILGERSIYGTTLHQNVTMSSTLDPGLKTCRLFSSHRVILGPCEQQHLKKPFSLSEAAAQQDETPECLRCIQRLTHLRGAERDPFNTSLNPTVAPDLLNKMTKRGGTKQTAFIIIFWSYLHLLLTKHGMWRNLNVFLKCNRRDMCFFFFFLHWLFFLHFFPTHTCLWLPQPRLHLPSQSRHGARCIWCSTLAVLSL